MSLSPNSGPSSFGSIFRHLQAFDGDAPPSLLISDAEPDGSQHILMELRSAMPYLRVLRTDEAGAGEVLAEVCIAHLTLGGTDDIGRAAQHLASQQDCVMVFWADDLDSPQVRAARALGITRILSHEAICAWLPGALPALICESRARRRLRWAEAQVPPVPSSDGQQSVGKCEALPQAEMKFRESYIRYVLAATRNRREAAQVAGVPYRTLCDILKKLDIRPDGKREAI